MNWTPTVSHIKYKSATIRKDPSGLIVNPENHRVETNPRFRKNPELFQIVARAFNPDGPMIDIPPRT